MPDIQGGYQGGGYQRDRQGANATTDFYGRKCLRFLGYRSVGSEKYTLPGGWMPPHHEQQQRQQQDQKQQVQQPKRASSSSSNMSSNRNETQHATTGARASKNEQQQQQQQQATVSKPRSNEQTIISRSHFGSNPTTGSAGGAALPALPRCLPLWLPAWRGTQWLQHGGALRCRLRTLGRIEAAGWTHRGWPPGCPRRTAWEEHFSSLV